MRQNIRLKIYSFSAVQRILVRIYVKESDASLLKSVRPISSFPAAISRKFIARPGMCNHLHTTLRYFYFLVVLPKSGLKQKGVNK